MLFAEVDLYGVAAVISAILSGIAAIMTIRTRHDVRKVELATNSMKDALVKATGDAKMAEGEAKGRADQKAESAL